MSREAHVLVLREPQGKIPWGYSPDIRGTFSNTVAKDLRGTQTVEH